jgi:hypothetical protein
MHVQVLDNSRFNPPGLLVPEPVFPWGPDGPAFIACPGAVPHGMVAASRSHFLHVGDRRVPGRTRWEGAMSGARREAMAEARRGGRRRQRAAKKAAREAAAPAESDPE